MGKRKWQIKEREKTKGKKGEAEKESQQIPSTQGEKELGSLEAHRLAFPRQRVTERHWER